MKYLVFKHYQLAIYQMIANLLVFIFLFTLFMPHGFASVTQINSERAVKKYRLVAAESIAKGAIEITAGVKHSVPLAKILSGGPPKDGIPPIDAPNFESVSEANSYLRKDSLGISVSFDGIDRYYPFQILVWHEIVNDVVGSQPITATYCPLCGTGIVFNPYVGGKLTTFGTSGKLYQSNLVMYDRLTDTYWSQVLGKAIAGQHTGERLELLPYKNMTWQDWSASHPRGEVLSRKTGHFRDYTRSPYGDYDTNRSIYFAIDNLDNRYHPKSPAFEIYLDGKHKVYVIEELQKKRGAFIDQFNGHDIVVDFDPLTKTVTFTDKQAGREIVPTYGFWFSILAVYPDIEVFVKK